jgi:hypothetical protein
MRWFLASNSLAILSLIAIKNSPRESREGQGARVHQSSFCPGARGWLSPALFWSIICPGYNSPHQCTHAWLYIVKYLILFPYKLLYYRSKLFSNFLDFDKRFQTTWPQLEWLDKSCLWAVSNHGHGVQLQNEVMFNVAMENKIPYQLQSNICS